MIARVFIDLPYTIHLPPMNFELLSWSAADFKISVNLDEMRTTESAVLDSSVSVNGQLCQPTSKLVLDFKKESFDLSIQNALQEPSSRAIEDVANSFIRKFRSVSNASFIESVDLEQTSWAIKYLHDDGVPPESDPSKFRSRFSKMVTMQFAVLTPEQHKYIFDAGVESTPPPWEMLLLDANESLPAIGPAIVLASTSLEVLIKWALDVLASEKKISPEIWSWITEERPQYLQPTVEESFDKLLKVVSGKSLKDQRLLWEAFLNLKTARNKFVHDGIPMLGGEKLSYQKALLLLQKTREIAEFIRELMPEHFRWNKFEAKIPLKVEASAMILKA